MGMRLIAVLGIVIVALAMEEPEVFEDDSSEERNNIRGLKEGGKVSEQQRASIPHRRDPRQISRRLPGQSHLKRSEDENGVLRKAIAVNSLLPLTPQTNGDSHKRREILTKNRRPISVARRKIRRRLRPRPTTEIILLPQSDRIFPAPPIAHALQPAVLQPRVFQPPFPSDVQFPFEIISETPIDSDFDPSEIEQAVIQAVQEASPRPPQPRPAFRSIVISTKDHTEIFPDPQLRRRIRPQPPAFLRSSEEEPKRSQLIRSRRPFVNIEEPIPVETFAEATRPPAFTRRPSSFIPTIISGSTVGFETITPRPTFRRPPLPPVDPSVRRLLSTNAPPIETPATLATRRRFRLRPPTTPPVFITSTEAVQTSTAIAQIETTTFVPTARRTHHRRRRPSTLPPILSTEITTTLAPITVALVDPSTTPIVQEIRGPLLQPSRRPSRRRRPSTTLPPLETTTLPSTSIAIVSTTIITPVEQRQEISSRPTQTQPSREIATTNINPVDQRQTFSSAFSRPQPPSPPPIPSRQPQPTPTLPRQPEIPSAPPPTTPIIQEIRGPLPPSPPSAPPPRQTGPPAPPGAAPPNDNIVNELNEAEDFVAAAKRLQIIRHRRR